MKKIIIKKIWFAVFVLPLLVLSQLASAKAAEPIIASFDVTAYSPRTLSLEAASALLKTELDNLKSFFDTKRIINTG